LELRLVSITFHVRTILFVSIIFDEILASRDDEAPIHGIRKTESGIFLYAHATSGYLCQVDEADLRKGFAGLAMELRVKGRTTA